MATLIQSGVTQLNLRDHVVKRFRQLTNLVPAVRLGSHGVVLFLPDDADHPGQLLDWLGNQALQARGQQDRYQEGASQNPGKETCIIAKQVAVGAIEVGPQLERPQQLVLIANRQGHVAVAALHVNPLRSIRQPLRARVDDFQSLDAERLDQPLGEDGSEPADEPRAEVLGDPLGSMRWRGLEFVGLELQAVRLVIHPVAARFDVLAMEP